MTLSYLATPFSLHPRGHEAAFIEAARIAGKLVLSGVNCYSPIVSCYPLSVHAGLDPMDLRFWLGYDEVMLHKADVLIVAPMDGWKESKGMAHEIAFFERQGKPIFDLHLRTFKMVKR